MDVCPAGEYHGGGAAATIEPLRETSSPLWPAIGQSFWAGVQACYRGPQLL